MHATQQRTTHIHTLAPRARGSVAAQRPGWALHGAPLPKTPSAHPLALRGSRAPMKPCRTSIDDIENIADIDGDEVLGRDVETGNVEDDEETRAFALAMSRIAWELKGEDLLLLHVAPVVYWTRYMLFVTVFSRPQLQAVLGKIEKAAGEEFDMRSSGTTKSSSWELLDFGAFVVHVMTADEREYYDLESFYAAADEVPLPFDDEAAKQNLDWRSKM
jgi:ribosome silencing factor RsfS/YbeB/iojap